MEHMFLKARSRSSSRGLIALAVLVAGAQALLRSDCSTSDQLLRLNRENVCSSLTQANTSWCGNSWQNVTAKTDWPHQAYYMHGVLDVLTTKVSPSCLASPYATDTIKWLNGSQADPSVSGSWAWTYLVFQVQYYDQPRKPGARIESPGVLGRKCWAFAYLKEKWNPASLNQALAAANTSAPAFVSMYDNAINVTMAACNKVKMSCFVNATPVPATCPSKVLEFKGGFELENVELGDDVKYPFDTLQ